MSVHLSHACRPKAPCPEGSRRGVRRLPGRHGGGCRAPLRAAHPGLPLCRAAPLSLIPIPCRGGFSPQRVGDPPPRYCCEPLGVRLLPPCAAYLGGLGRGPPALGGSANRKRGTARRLCPGTARPRSPSACGEVGPPRGLPGAPARPPPREPPRGTQRRPPPWTVVHPPRRARAGDGLLGL